MKKQHTWGNDGFCVHCSNVHRTDCNARSTCSDGFTCSGGEQIDFRAMRERQQKADESAEYQRLRAAYVARLLAR